MLNKKETHEVFGKVWKEFNKVRKNNTDDGWSECVKNVDELHSKYDNKFYKKIMLIVFLAVITPSASTVTQMCQVYGNDSRYASAINVVTTLCAVVTMPVMVLLYEEFI